ncbi:MAG: HAMP domain-containing protein, partial [Anaerolineaceae bacterium]
TGQTLLDDYAATGLLNGTDDEIHGRLDTLKNAYPFFTDLCILTTDGKRISHNADCGGTDLSEERAVLSQAEPGDEILPFAAAPIAGQKSARIVFAAPLAGRKGGLQGVLFGYTSLQTNPFTQSAVQAIESIEQAGGEGWILDQDSRVLYHSNPDYVMSRTFGSASQDDLFYEQGDPDGVPSILYYQDTAARLWSMAFRVPSSQVQQTALDIAIPLLTAILVIAVVVFLLIQRLLAQMTRSLHVLADQAGQIARGQLDHPLAVNQPDEVGQLAIAFEQMRRGLKTRLKDINSLLKVSQAAAYHPDPRRTVLPVLESFLGKNASAARAIFFDNEHLDATPRIAYTYGIGHRSAY